jgi:hypothetical protein
MGGYELDIVKTYKKKIRSPRVHRSSIAMVFLRIIYDRSWIVVGHFLVLLNSLTGFFLRLVILLPTEARAIEIPSSKRPPTIEKMPRTDSTLNCMSVSVLDILSSSFCSRIYPCQSILQKVFLIFKAGWLVVIFVNNKGNQHPNCRIYYNWK